MDPNTSHAIGGNGHSKTRIERVKQAVAPKLNDARDYFQGHRLVTAMIGLGLGLLVGRLLRRS